MEIMKWPEVLNKSKQSYILASSNIATLCLDKYKYIYLNSKCCSNELKLFGKHFMYV